MRRRIAVMLALAACAATAMAGQQTPVPRFQGGVELIQLTVSVLDGRRQPVRGLTEADFTVLDNGASRPIRAFTAVNLPSRQPVASTAAAAWTRDIASDVATNQVGEEPGRLVVILMDRSIPHEAPVVTARKIATSIVDSLGPNDRAALISTSGGEPQNFTNDRARLIKAINQRDWATDSDEYPWGLEASLEDGRCLCGICVLDTVTRVAEAVRDASSRSRSLFFIGQGLIVQAPPRDPQLDPGCDRLTRNARVKMEQAIALSNLTVHSIDPSGLNSIGPQTRASTPGGGPLPEGMAARQRREAQQKETSDTLAKQNTLRVLPDLTGGRTVVNRNVPEEIVPEIFRESEAYYLIGVEAPTGITSDMPREIEVRVRRNGVRVSTRREYVPPSAGGPALVASASPPPATAQPIDSLTGLLPDGAPPLKLGLAAFAGADDANAVVSITVDGRAFVADAESTIPLQLGVTVVDQTGRIVTSARQTSIVVGPRPALADSAPIDLHTHVTLPPGDYEVRVAVSDDARGASASVFGQVVVPDFRSERLSLSDLVLERDTKASTPTSATPVLTAAPTTVRSFARDESVHAFLQVYQGTERTEPAVPVSLQTRIVDIRDRVVFEKTDRLDAEMFQGRRADFRAAIPVETLTAGDYLFTVVATAGERSGRRVTRFTVR